MNDPIALIVEDDNDIATIFAAALQTAGYQTEIISDGKTARTRLEETEPHVVVLDLHLPFVSGEDLLQQIRADERLKHTRVILATADPLLAKSLESVANLVLLKPISFSQLRILSERFHPDALT